MGDVTIQHTKRKVRFRNVGRKEGLVNVVVRAIQEQILDGRLVVGSRLPGEEEFAERLGVSRPVVREAIRSLVAKGMLDTRQGIGTMVRSVTHEQIAAPLSLFLRTCGQEVNLEHLHQVRSILEVGNAALAAQHRSEADVADLVRLCNEMKACADNPEVFSDRDSEFHRRVSLATQNPLLTLLLDSIHRMMAEVRVLVSRQPGLFDRVMPTHIRLVDSIMMQDSVAARAAMREHLEIALAIQKELIAKAT
ncbi:MAG: FadR/GntR family transcriptional regulator [Terriglobia bacterium]